MVTNFIDRLKESYKRISNRLKRRALFKNSPILQDRTKHHASPSGRYVLTVESLDMGKGHWQYTRGTIKTKSGKKIDVVNRNYSSFPFAFVENHPDGHDYLICGENYQGQTIIQLDTKNRVDFVPDAAAKGHGFCWAAIHPSPDGRTLAVEGCYWASPYEIIFVDFSDPFLAPLPELHRDHDNEEFIAWTSPTAARIGRREEISLKHGKPEYELTREELDELSALPDDEYVKAWKDVLLESTWIRT